ncbi:unnamed protein product, partial [Rotaria magnacalcarata]
PRKTFRSHEFPSVKRDSSCCEKIELLVERFLFVHTFKSVQHQPRMIRITLILCVIFFIEINARRHRCIDSGVSFSDKISRSPIVVYGASIEKQIYLQSKTELLFNVTLQVDCIFKGQDVEKEIKITEAGIKVDHTACQSLEQGSYYIVFLEKWGTNTNSYRPVDFHEVMFDNMTNELLEKTCHLTRISPLNSTINVCPNVATHEYCPHDDNDVSITSSEEYSNNVYNYEKTSNFDDDKKFNHQSHVIITKDGSVATHSDIHSRNDARSSAAKCISLIIIMIMISYDFEMFNISQDYVYSY